MSHIFMAKDGELTEVSVTQTISNITVPSGVTGVKLFSESASSNLAHFKLGPTAGTATAANSDFIAPNQTIYQPVTGEDDELSLICDTGETATVWVIFGNFHALQD